MAMTHLQLNQLSSLLQSVTGLQWERVHPVTMPTEQDLAQKLPDIPTLAVLAQDIRNKHKGYLHLPVMTVLITGSAEVSVEVDSILSPNIPLLLLTGVFRNASNLYSFLLS